jgi:hypothetical protein
MERRGKVLEEKWGGRPWPPLVAGTEARPTNLVLPLSFEKTTWEAILGALFKDFISSRHQTGGTGVSPVQAHAFACGYKNDPLNATRYYWQSR